jgi:TRAP-type C4-dicarboxylate transport system substrate-binding protein
MDVGLLLHTERMVLIDVPMLVRRCVAQSIRFFNPFGREEPVMKKALTTIFCIALALCFLTSASYAAENERNSAATNAMIWPSGSNSNPVTEKIRWKMVMPWSKGLLFYDIAVHFADSVRLASAGRLDIKPFSAGELVPAMQSFDAVSEGLRPCRP